MSSFRKPRNVNRYSSGSWVDGRWVPGTILSTFTIMASIQPASSKDMQSLPEGRRDRSMYAMFTNTPLHIESIEAGTNPDVVALPDADGIISFYEVTQNSDWQNGVINHYRYIVTRASKAVG